MKNKPIIFFDGVCVLCNSGVQFILDKEKSKYYYFVSLQSELGQQFLNDHNMLTKDFDTVVLFENNKISTKSSAILLISKQLLFPYSFLFSLLIIPKFIRDYFYNIIAKKRYSWFGKDENCQLIAKENEHRIFN